MESQPQNPEFKNNPETFTHGLTCVFGKTPKRVVLQTGKTQMKCSLVLHFISVYTVCKGK